MTSCSLCPNEATGIFYGSLLCDTCRENICFFCSELNKKVMVNSECPSHEIGAAFKGNRFMEDKAFMSGGPFEFEP